MPLPLELGMIGPREAPFGGTVGDGTALRPIDGSAAFLSQTESAESLPLYGQEFLGTGLSQGTGRVVLLDVVRLGGKVTVLTRDVGKVESTIAAAKTEQEAGSISGEIDIEKHILPVGIDFSDPETILPAVGTIAEKVTSPFAGKIHASAGGMEPYSRKLMGELTRLKGIKDKQGDEAFTQARDAMQAGLAQWVNDAMPYANEVNYSGPFALLTRLHQEGMLARGAKVINFASVWTDMEGQEGAEIPLWYKPVSVWKKKFDEELQSPDGKAALESQGIHPYTVVGQVVDDTLVGKMVNRFILPLLSDEARQKYQANNKPMTTADMSKAVQIMLLTSPNEPGLWTPGEPRKLYVLGPTETEDQARENIVRQIPQDHPMRTFRSPV